LTISEKGLEILWVIETKGLTPPARIDVGTTGEGIGFPSETTGTVFDNKVEAREKFGPSGLATI
jgi:hypothetical protein